MYLSEVYATNFRCFGDGENALSLRLQKGLNTLVGENDSGKTSIVDAIRFCLWTTSQDYHRFTTDDFHCTEDGRKGELTIRCKFEELTKEDQGAFLEYLTVKDGEAACLYVHLQARRLEATKGSRISVVSHAGERGDGPVIDGIVREMLRTTYLRPLRDAEAELSAGRNSRLSQILSNHPEIANQETNDFDEEAGTATTLVGIMKRADFAIERNAAIEGARNAINVDYLSRFNIGRDELKSDIRVSSDSSLGRILEKLELRLASTSGLSAWTRRGLGYNNALFMSAELLLLGQREVYPMLLIEEPEAHLHPQLQSRVIELLNSKSNQETHPVQVLLTTHSPNLASSVPLERITLVYKSKTFSLAPAHTGMMRSDYAFLQRFLDVTKSNLFFAKGVAIVEGDAENLLLPALAARTNRHFSAHGVSVVNVGHTGAFRYSNIFKRSNGSSIPINVACIKDRDIVPDGTPQDLKGGLKAESELSGKQHTERREKLLAGDHGTIKTYISDHWTFEYDLAVKSWKMAKIMHQAIQGAKLANEQWPTEAELSRAQAEAATKVDEWITQGLTLKDAALMIYAPLKKKQASKAITAQLAATLIEKIDIEDGDLPDYIVASLKHLVGEGGV